MELSSAVPIHIAPCYRLCFHRNGRLHGLLRCWSRHSKKFGYVLQSLGNLGYFCADLFGHLRFWKTMGGRRPQASSRGNRHFQHLERIPRFFMKVLSHTRRKRVQGSLSPSLIPTVFGLTLSLILYSTKSSSSHPPGLEPGTHSLEGDSHIPAALTGSCVLSPSQGITGDPLWHTFATLCLSAREERNWQDSELSHLGAQKHR